MGQHLTRRELLGAGLLAAEAGLAEAAPAKDALPTRPLGKTGIQVPILGFGTAPAGIRRSLENGAALYEEALALGVTYFDTAPSHTGYGRAQNQMGEFLKRRRKQVFLVTKCHESNGDAALRLLEKNLKELRTDRADLVHVHSLGDLDQAVAMGKNGVLQALLKAKREGLTRFVGLSGHHRPGLFRQILERFDIDVVMNAVNFVDRHTYGFEEKVWPIAARKNVALVAMKVFGGMVYRDKGMSNSMMPKDHLRQAFRYALSEPQVATAVVGMATSEELRRNVAWAKQFQPLTAEERQSLEPLGKRLAAEWGAHFGAVA